MSGLGLASQILNSGTGGGSGKITWVDTIAQRDAIAHSKDKVVRVRNAYLDDPTVDQGWAEYTSVNAAWEKTGEQEQFDESFYPTVPDSALSTVAVGSFPAGTTAGVIKANPPTWNDIESRRAFPRIPYVYDSPSASINNVTGIVEVGEIFSTAITASLDQDDAGAANRVEIQVNESTVQNSDTLPLDYTYTDSDAVLGDGQTRRYRTIIHHDTGAVKQDSYGDDQLPLPSSVTAGSVTSATRTKTSRRPIFHGLDIAKPTNSAEGRALPNVQFDNDLTFTIQLQTGNLNIPILAPSHLTLKSCVFVGAFTSDLVGDFLATEETLKVEGGSTGAVNVVANEAAMLALSPAIGDLADRTDNGITYVFTGGDATNAANWIRHSDNYRLFYYQFASAVVGTPVINVTLQAI